MRRWLVAAAVGCALALSACSTPTGPDGDLGDDWSAMPTPRSVPPVVGGCYPTRLPNMLVNAIGPCDRSHLVQTVYVGTFAGADASASAPPAEISAARKRAYAACTTAARTFLGGDWHTGLFGLGLSVPDKAGWSGGERWFRCDVNETDSAASNSAEQMSTRDLRGVLAGPHAEVLTCVDWDNSKKYISNFRGVSCARKHDGEFAGVFTATDLPWLTSSARSTLAEKGCAGVVASFLGFGNVKAYVSETVGYAWNNFDEDQWNLGDRGVRCFAAAFTKDRKFIGSVKGIRSATAKG